MERELKETVRLWAALWSPECSQGWKSAGAAPSFPVQMNWLRHPAIPWPGEAYSSHTGRSPWTEGSYSGSVTLQAKGPQLPSFPHCYLMSTAHLRILGYCLLHCQLPGWGLVMSPPVAQYLAHSLAPCRIQADVRWVHDRRVERVLGRCQHPPRMKHVHHLSSSALWASYPEEVSGSLLPV